MHKLRVGLIGVGSMGRNHLRIFSMLKDVELVFIYDTNIDILNKLSHTSQIRASNNLDADMKLIDTVIIVTPTSTHFDYILKAGNYVKNIFVEKPLTDSIESSKRVVEIARERQLKIQVGFIERFNPAVIALKKVLKHTNNIINIDFTRTNKVSSRITDVDVVSDLMIHDIDLALFLNGKANEIHAYGVVENNLIAYARAIIRHENGAFSNIVSSRITEKRVRQITVTSENMYVDCNLLSKELLINKQSIEQYLDDVSITSKEETIDVRPEEPLLSEILTFLKFCQGTDNDIIPTEINGLEAIEIVNEVQKQIR